MREKFKVAGAFLIGLSVASSVTFAQLGGRGRNVQFVDGATISPTSVVASGVSDQFVCSSTTSTCEISSSATSATTTINIPAIDIGPTATPSAQDKLVCFSYGPSGSKTRAACIDKEGDGFFSNISGNYINSDVASGSTAYNCTNTGCRLSLGNTARYFYDTGVDIGLTGANLYLGSATQLIYVAKIQEPNQNATLTLVGGKSTSAADSVGITLQTRTQSVAGAKIASFQNGTSEVSFIDYLGNVSGNGFVATTASGSALTGGGASGPLLLTSNATDAATSGTVPAIRLQASQNITDTDLLMSVEDSAGNRRLTLTEAGNNLVLPDTFGTFTSGSSGTFQNPSNTAQVVGTRSSDANSIGVILRNSVDLTVEGARIATLRNATTDVASFSKDGLLRVNENNRAKPTCNATNRGRVFYLDGVTGGGATADTFEVCMKNASDVYAWKTIVTP